MTELTLLSWNINGARAIYRAGFLEWLAQSGADILCLQETRAEPEQLPPDLRQPPGYHAFWHGCERKKGYSGTALLSRIEPQAMQFGLGRPEFDDEGRTIIADYGAFTLINCYFPNGSRDHSRVPYKMAFYDAFLSTCERLRGEGKGVLFCGDVNTAHREIDLARPRENVNTTGFLPEERAWLDQVVALGYVDTFRHFYPDLAGQYTWWSVPLQSQGAERRLAHRLFLRQPRPGRVHLGCLYPARSDRQRPLSGGRTAAYMSQMNPFDILQGKTAVITGSGRGIGRAIGIALAGHGANVAVNYYRHKERAEETARAIEEAGGRAVVVKAHVGEIEGVQKLVSAAAEAFGGVDIFVGNAASGVLRPVLQQEPKGWDWTLNVNTRSILLGAQAAAPYMIERGWGRIIAVTSIGSTRVLPEYSMVGISKAGIEALIRYLAVELAPRGIICNAISPGVVETEALDFFPRKEQMIEHATAFTPMGRLVAPEEVARVAAWLCTDDAKMIVGQTIVVDGGYQVMA